jgi:predicted DNA binding CopG/RHH family protein
MIPKTVRIDLRLTPELKTLIKTKAKAQGMPVKAYLIHLVISDK